jgi:hypothetical protein
MCGETVASITNMPLRNIVAFGFVQVYGVWNFLA